MLTCIHLRDMAQGLVINHMKVSRVQGKNDADYIAVGDTTIRKIETHKYLGTTFSSCSIMRKLKLEYI